MTDYDSDAKRYAPQRVLTYLYGHDAYGNEGKMPAFGTVEKLTANSFTPAYHENGMIKILTDASGVAVTLRNDHPKGYAVRLVQGGAGALTLTAQSGATIRGANATNAQWSGVTAVVIDQGADGKSAEWLVG